ncbi:MAG: PQQ-binding-like beta-propeller repeat protein, partial [Verrucomicrobiota bacterium]|nr:PQQ-binding-like beta-propeller repeat protein [Verrucomicrobiota bacterium]
DNPQKAKENREQLENAQKKLYGYYGYEDYKDVPKESLPKNENEAKKIREKIQELYQNKPLTKRYTICLDAKSGKEKWRKELFKAINLTNLLLGANSLIGIYVPRVPAEGPKSVLIAHDIENGNKKWQIKMPQIPPFPPKMTDEKILLLFLGGEIHAFAEDGKELYTIAANQISFSTMYIDKGLLFLKTNGTVCHDLKTGKKLWSTDVDSKSNGIIVGKKKVYIYGSVLDAVADSDKGEKLPPAYKELKEMDEFKGIMNKPTTKTVSVLVAFDKKSGRKLWRRQGLYGWLLGNDERLINIADTALTSLRSMMTGAKGYTVIRQIDPDDGADILMKTNDIGFIEPQLAGKYVVGFHYTRKKHVSALNPYGYEGDTQEFRIDGITAFRIR